MSKKKLYPGDLVIRSIDDWICFIVAVDRFNMRYYTMLLSAKYNSFHMRWFNQEHIHYYESAFDIEF